MLVESRGEGGYIVGVGSPASVHASGNPYVQTRGPVLPEIPTITPEERTLLWRAAAELDRRGDPMAEYVTAARRSRRGPVTIDTSTPWGDFDARADWHEILGPHGWTTADGIAWRRPGKTGGTSAKIVTARDGSEALTVFSSSAGTLAPSSTPHHTWGKFAAMAGLLALANCAAAIAKRIEVSPWRGWTEPANLYVAAILDPGNRKSAVFADATQPLRDVERELRDQCAADVAKEQSERRQAEKRLAKLEKTAAESNDEAKRIAAAEVASELAMQLASWIRPELPTLIADDATSERLAVLMQTNGERIASMSAEGGVFDLMAGKYSKTGAADMGVYLMGHAGDAVSVDRVSRPSVRLQNPAMTMALTIQPEVVRGLAANTAFRGRGLLGRFLYAVPQSWIGQRNVTPSPVGESVAAGYAATIRALAVIANDEYGRPNRLTLSDEAMGVFVVFCRWLESELDTGSLELMRDWGAQLAGATLRIAAALHCARNAGGPCLPLPRHCPRQDAAQKTIPHHQVIAFL